MIMCVYHLTLYYPRTLSTCKTKRNTFTTIIQYKAVVYNISLCHCPHEDIMSLSIIALSHDLAFSICQADTKLKAI